MTTETKDIAETNERQAARGSDGADHLKAVAMRAYNGHKHNRIGDEEILHLLPMVRKIARRAVSYLKPPLSFEDLVSAGTVGLLKAARDFDASHQAEFKTYAYIRIKGAVLDELRRASLLPSGLNRQIRTAQELSRRIAEQTGTPPTDEELAGKLGISVPEVYELFEKCARLPFCLHRRHQRRAAGPGRSSAGRPNRRAGQPPGEDRADQGPHRRHRGTG